jgi:regulator of nucleoside diphosphate kinase
MCGADDDQQVGLDELERQLRQEAFGRVQEVTIRPVGDTVVVHCRSESYYGVQVVLAALGRLAHSDKMQTRMQVRADVNGRQFDLPVSRLGSRSDRASSERYSVMTHRKIIVTEADLCRLERLLASEFAAAIGSSKYLNDLRAELERAEIVPVEEVPEDVVTMNSTVVLRDLDTDEVEKFTLVYPQKASIANNRVSILAPVGTAILGYRVGDVVRWPVPSGMRRLRIEEVVYQPERVGALHL